MPITAFSEISGWIGGVKFNGAGGMTSSSTTGTVDTSTCTDLSGAGATFADINDPRNNSGDSVSALNQGIICPITAETNTTRDGCQMTLPAGTWPARRMIFVACVTPVNMVGMNDSDTGRVFTCDNGAGGGPFVSVQKGWKRGASTNYNGNLNIHGGGGTQVTVGHNGIQRQVVALRSTNASGAFGYCNRDGSENTSGATGSASNMTVVDIGCLSNGSGLNNTSPFMGVIHELHAFNLGASGDYTEQNMLDAMELLASQWGVTQAAATTAVMILGDSIGYSSGTLWETQVNTGANARSALLTTSPIAGATAFDVDAVPAGWAANTRIVVKPGTDQAQTLVISSIAALTINFTTTPLRVAHSSGETVCNDYYGFTSPYACWPMLSKKIGDASGGVELLNYSTASANINAAQGNSTTLSGAHGSGVTVLNVASSAGFAANRVVVIGYNTPNQEMRTVASVGAGTITVTVATSNSHADTDEVWGTPSDGSMDLVADFANTTYVIQRGSNDFVNGETAAAVLADFEALAARADVLGFDKVIVVKVLDRVPSTWNAAIATLNGNLASGVGSTWDAVANIHWLLTDPTNPLTLTYSGATGATTVYGLIYDPLGVHPRHFGNACQALMFDKAYATAWGVSVGYSPTTPGVTMTRSGQSVTLTWTTPASPNAPRMFARPATDDGPSGLVVKVRRNGTLIATVAPLSVSASTGTPDWTGRLSYTDTGYTPGDTYTVQVEDAATNTSGTVTINPSGGSRMNRMNRMERVVRV